MKRGRPSDGYSREEFRNLLLSRREFLNLSIAALAELARVNRGTLSQVLRGQRPCGRTDRAALIRALGLGRQVQEQFLAYPQTSAPEPDLILLDPPTSPHPPLERGQRFLICAIYPEALQEFMDVFRAAAETRSYVLQADAAARMAWVHYEMGLSQDALNWVARSIRLIETFVGASLAEIIESVQPGSRSALCGLNDEASHVLARALQVRCKVLVERIVYRQEHELRSAADNAFAQSLALDEYLQISAQLGHDLRWRAVLLTSGMEPLRKESESLLCASLERFPHGSLGAAYVARDRGAVRWLTDRHASARDSLLEAVDGLSSFADARALGPTFCILSKVILQGGGDHRLARRYALAGATLHPHGFVLGNAREHLRTATQEGLRRDVDDLLSGNKPFDVLNPVMSRLTDGSPNNTTERLDRNLSCVLGAAFQVRAGHGDGVRIGS